MNQRQYSAFFIPVYEISCFLCAVMHFKKKINPHCAALHSNQSRKLSLLGLISFSQYTPTFTWCECLYRCYLHVNCLSSNINKMLFSSHKQPHSMLFCCFYHAATFNSVWGWQKPKAKLESTKYMLLWLIDWTKSKTQGDYLLKCCQTGTKDDIAVPILCIIVNPYTLVWRKQAMEENEDKNKYRIKITQGQGEGV